MKYNKRPESYKELDCCRTCSFFRTIIPRRFFKNTETHPSTDAHVCVIDMEISNLTNAMIEDRRVHVTGKCNQFNCGD